VSPRSLDASPAGDPPPVLLAPSGSRARGGSAAFWTPRLAQHLRTPERAIVITRGPRGEPRLTVDGRPHPVSFSSCEGWRACALGDGPAVGIDIENRADLPDLDALIDRALAPPERARLRASSPTTAAASLAFLGLWTRKEAALKALTTGLSIDPRTAIVETRPADPCPVTIGPRRVMTWAIKDEAFVGAVGRLG